MVELEDQRCHVQQLLTDADLCCNLLRPVNEQVAQLAAPVFGDLHPSSPIHHRSEALILHTPARSFSFLFSNGATAGERLVEKWAIPTTKRFITMSSTFPIVSVYCCVNIGLS